jgi:CheY-like chemotaxis protein
VVTLLETLAENPALFPAGLDARVALYQLFLRMWNDPTVSVQPSYCAKDGESCSRVRALTSKQRQAFFLYEVEEFEPAAIAQILGVEAKGLSPLFEAAGQEMMTSMPQKRILIIEDEPLEAMLLADIFHNIGHEVTGIAKTHQEAVALAKIRTPDLLFSSRILADGSCGVAAAAEIIASSDVPVIVITAFCEPLLTGERPEPVFVLNKPYRHDAILAMLAQALLLRDFL